MPEQEKPFGVPGTADEPGRSAEEEAQALKAANRFDIRRLIGGLFLVYGLILGVVGLVGSHTVKTKAAGINVDLWTGLAMLVFGGLMVFWALAKPVLPEPPPTRGEGSGAASQAPAT